MFLIGKKRLPPEAPRGIPDLQVGCGPKHLRPNWWNTDLRPFQGLDETLDATAPWRWVDTLGHVLTNAGRALRPGGHIRLSMPGLEWVMRSHYRFEPGTDAQVLDTLRTNRAFHGWGHQFLYSRGMFEWLFTNLNYNDVRFRDYGKSEIPIFQDIEMHGKFRMMDGYSSMDRRGEPGDAPHRARASDDGTDPEGTPRADAGRALIPRPAANLRAGPPA